ncbi:hypothetical protein N7281_03335 [Rickettsia hoogstraalii]|uniref:hypothetical protein n=1 Tax=Rickettsia hoogstraalii TaxID=467174 RepID=UPI00224DC835|nr:hypothetical protein [Rickettsia hoogstraalii]MCX4083902.1 hypothetical protein [Rickettsia hoogstraalii]
MNDILNIIPYLAIYSIIPSIFILNQSAKYRSFKKALPSVIVAWICYSFIVSIDMLFSQFFIVTIIFTIGIVELIFLIYMVYNLWTQSYFNLTAEPQPISIWKQILVSMLISILSALNPYGMFIMHMYFIKHSSNNIGIIDILIFTGIWFLSLAIIGYNIKKLNKNAIILNIINKVGAIIIGGMVLLCVMLIISVMD